MEKCQSLHFADVSLLPERVYEAMGYGSQMPEENVRNMVQNAISFATGLVFPSFYYCSFDARLYAEYLQVSGHDFEFCLGKTISKLLDKSEYFIAFAATSGEAYQNCHDRFSSAGDALQLFVWDALGSCITEATGDLMERYVEKELCGIPHTNRFSPGYCGWHVSEQQKLFSLMPYKICGISLNDSSLMYPIKSISGIMGVGVHVDTRKYGCQFCGLDNCYKKRARLIYKESK